jgi:acyl transferase domain-containing protein/acyl carrier protein/NAD(P)-dependent dehydrogenase (short-subunit alcohol dehydrogenase family)
MKSSSHKAIAVVGLGAVLPDAPNVDAVWNNLKTGRYSITDVPTERWNPDFYWDPDPAAPDRSYSKIGGWVRDFEWQPLKWRLPIPPLVSNSMDRTQKWSIIGARQALQSFGYPDKPLDANRTAVILGNAMAGDNHLISAIRLASPEYADELQKAPSFSELPDQVRTAIGAELRQGISKRFPPITEDTMPGELANIIAGRVANVFNFHGPNFVCDAACASAMAAISAAIEGLEENNYDSVLTGGIDANMSASSYIKFCKIGALSATGTRPYAEGADGFVMGEGAAMFLLKRLEDAERDGDRIFAVLRGVGGSSDGKGKGITAPNPVGQRLAVERAWANAGISPATATYVEGHGTSTKVGDVVEVDSLNQVFGSFGLEPESIGLGSIKSNIGHLKGAAGAAGILKTALALHHKELPPNVGFERPNPNIDFSETPFFVNTDHRPWEKTVDGVRRAGVSAFGFGGTNFHAVLEEYIPGRIESERKTTVAFHEPTPGSTTEPTLMKAPLEGILLLGADTHEALVDRTRQALSKAREGADAPSGPPSSTDLKANVRLAIAFSEAPELEGKLGKALMALEKDEQGIWRALEAQGVYRGVGYAKATAFLYTGQGSQYINMLRTLRACEPIVSATFDEADRVMEPILGHPLTDVIFPAEGEESLRQAEKELRQTAITQPAVLTVDIALTRLLAAYGIEPDMVMGHSLGEYGALVSAGALSFAQALEAVSARGREMTHVSMDDNGKMAAVFAPASMVEPILETVEGYVVVANHNSFEQVVVGGASAAVEAAMEACAAQGLDVAPLPVSHAFHTSIVAPASEPVKKMLSRLDLHQPRIPVISNVHGDFYPTGPDAAPQLIDLLSQQVAAPVRFLEGLNRLYDAGARAFVELGPKRALQGFAQNVLGQHEDVLTAFTNHPKTGGLRSFNQALAALYASGRGHGVERPQAIEEAPVATASARPPVPDRALAGAAAPSSVAASTGGLDQGSYLRLGQLFAGVLREGMEIFGGSEQPAREPVAITGAGLGLPGTDRVFDDTNVERILEGEQFIDSIPRRLRRQMVDKNITRLVKSEKGEPRFETIDSPADVIKLAGRGGSLDLVEEFGFPKERLPALDVVTQLAIGAGIDALRDAGIPLVMRYKRTTKGTHLPERWTLPSALQDDTGVIFASAFPGYDALIGELEGQHFDHGRRKHLADLQGLRERLLETHAPGDVPVLEIDHRIHELKTEIDRHAYTFDRRFLFRVLAMGHSQFAEYIGARGPNTQINSACASTTQALGLAEDWIRLGRCRRVIIISADDVTSDNMLDWIGAGFLASGAAATDEEVEDAAIPFDRRRHGMIVGMGAAALVVESAGAARERGVRPICEVLETATANSAFHGTRLDVQHIGQVMEKLVAGAERDWGIDRRQMARELMFVSHETYTPARGGSAQAEIHALRHVFGPDAERIVIANTKGFTGHPMGVGIEDVVAVKSLETGIVPPVANIKEPDPEFGTINLSRGGVYPVRYALRLGAGFGSQISLSLMRWVPTPDGARRAPDELGYAYRVSDPQAWQAWLTSLVGQPTAELEVERRTLRIADQGPPAREASIARPAPPLSAPAPAPAPLADSQVTAQPAAVDPPRPTPTPAPELAPPPQTDEVTQRVLEIVAEKTGYPPDMLELDLDLEADLGIDTVKQAEMFAAVREPYGIERDDNLALRDFPTLAHVIQFVYDGRPDLAPTSAAAVPPAPTTAATEPTRATPDASAALAAGNEVAQRVLQIVAEKTGYPPDMLEMDLDLEADLGIDTVKQAEMFAAVREPYNIERDDDLALRDFPTLAHVIQFVYDRRPDLAPASATGGPAAAGVSSTPVAQATPEPATDARPADDEVSQRVLEIVAEKTGYPPDMLELDLDLEADLGIDTVKQAEMFAAVREPYDIERDDDLALRDFPTLAHVIQFVYDRRPDLAPGSDLDEPSTPQESPDPAPSEDAPATDEVTLRVLEIFAAKTGYPTEMLELDLDLEADLGIDTVKQAEMFAAVREPYGIERDDNLALRDFPTLAHVIQFVYDRRPDLGSGEGQAPAQTAREAAAPASAEASSEIRVPRRVPVPVLRPALDLCKPTGVTLGDGDRVVVMPDRGGVAKALISRLVKLGVEVLSIDESQSADELNATLDEWQQAGPIKGAYWLRALDREEDIYRLSDEACRESLRVRVKLLYALARALYEQIGAAGGFLVAGTRFGGQHGYGSTGAVAPLGGAVAGFAKAFKRERQEALVKVVDFAPSRKTAGPAETLLAETLSDPGAVEIGYAHGHRWTVGLIEKESTEPDSATGDLELDSDSVFVVTGAAGGIVSAIVGDLARASAGTFHLLDLTPEPEADSADLLRFRDDQDALKRDLFERIKESGERATPAKVERELAKLERLVAAEDAIQTVRDAGGRVVYHQVDLLDAEAVASAIERVRTDSGRIDVLVHAAGLEISRLLPDKSPREFDLVFDVKIDGWFNLLRAIGEMPLGVAVAFSSIAGRFGNGGQTDYSSANDLLCKLTSHLPSARPGARGIAIDWTAWAQIGMATRGSIPTVMAAAGIDMLPPAEGVPVVRREISSGYSGEVLVAGSLGVMTAEWDPSGGLDLEPDSALDRAVKERGVMVGQIRGLNGGLEVATSLDPSRQPFLFDHKIDGTPVLPGVMGIEAFAETANLLFPDLHVTSVDDVRFLAPFKFYRGEPREVLIKVLFDVQGDEIVGDCSLLGSRLLHGQEEPILTTHFTARVRLAPEPAPCARGEAPARPETEGLAAEQIYEIYFHGPAYRVLERAWQTDERFVGLYPETLPANHEPAELPTVLDPRLIELCFQTAGLWEIESEGRLGLPLQVDRVAGFGSAPSPEARLATEVERGDDGRYHARVFDESGQVHLALEGYRTVELPGAIENETLDQLREALR